MGGNVSRVSARKRVAVSDQGRPAYVLPVAASLHLLFHLIALLFFVLFASLSFAVSFVRRFHVFPRSFFSFYIASLFGTTYSSFFFGSLCRLKNFHRS